MLSMKYFVYYGIDIHKKFMVATIATTDFHGVTSYIRGLPHLILTSNR